MCFVVGVLAVSAKPRAETMPKGRIRTRPVKPRGARRELATEISPLPAALAAKIPEEEAADATWVREQIEADVAGEALLEEDTDDEVAEAAEVEKVSDACELEAPGTAAMHQTGEEATAGANADADVLGAQSDVGAKRPRPASEGLPTPKRANTGGGWSRCKSERTGGVWGGTAATRSTGAARAL